MQFADLNLSAPILQAAAEIGYEHPSPIQEAAIPPVLEGRDLLGCAQTGTGKTAAFAMPVLQRLDGARLPKGTRPIRALILTPTRELALQIDESFGDYSRHMELRHTVIFGGVGQGPQVTALKRGIDILTATPGRLNDLIGQGYIHLDKVEIFVLDEADRMLDMGFVHDVERVLKYLPEKKQTLLFSATMPPEIERLASGLLHSPAKVMVAPPATTVDTVDQSLYYVDKGNKRYLLAQLLRAPDVESALVFTRTKHGADKVVRELSHEGIDAMAIHGNKSQNARQDALAKFKERRIRVLVATDIAARGIDVSGLSHVFNYDLPNIPETYVHRIGRTARAGKSGVAVSFCDFDEKEFLADIEKLTKQHIPTVEHAWPMKIFVKTEKKTQQRPPRAERMNAAPKAAKTKQSAAPKAASAKRNEGKNMAMEETARAAANAGQSNNANGENGEAKKRRRRRGGRRHGKGGQGGAPEGAQGGQPAQNSQNAQNNQSAQPQNRGAGQPRRGAQGGRTGGQFSQGGGAGRGNRNDRGAQNAPTQAPAAKPQPKLSETDDSIQIISRRAPVQKFTSFEDYISAHGGASAPIEDGDKDE